MGWSQSLECELTRYPILRLFDPGCRQRSRQTSKEPGREMPPGSLFGFSAGDFGVTPLGLEPRTNGLKVHCSAN